MWLVSDFIALKLRFEESLVVLTIVLINRVFNFWLYLIAKRLAFATFRTIA